MGKEVTFREISSQTSMGYTVRHLSSPRVTTISAGNSSLKRDGIVNLPLLSSV